MASNYVPLDEAARLLGVTPDRLVEMRSQGQLRGFRDGASWKFPADEIERIREEGLAGGSDIGLSGGSDIGLGGDGAGSDVELVARQGDGSDVELVASGLDEDDEELRLEDESISDLGLGLEPTDGSTGPGASDLRLSGDSNADVLGDMDLADIQKGGTGDLIRGDSDPDLALGSGIDDALSDDDDLVIAEDDDDLVLAGGGSDISIAGDSGINLMSPSDSGLSLESEPLDLAGSSISALDLGGAGVDSPSAGGSGSGSLVDFQADEEFQLSPSSVGVDSDDDSGSQVIEVEDSAAFVEDVDFGNGAFDDGAVMAADPLMDDAAVLGGDALVADDGMGDDLGIQPNGQASSGAVTAPLAYETPFSMWQVLSLMCILCVMCLGGMLMTDLMRNLWAYSEPATPVNSLTDALISMFGME